MSQENSYYTITRVKTVSMPSYADSVASIIQDLMRTAPIQLSANVKRLKTTANHETVLHSSENILQSPTSLIVLQKRFDQNLAYLNRNNSVENDEITNIKVAALSTMQQENLKIENKDLIAHSIQKLMSTTSIGKTTEQLISTFAEIKDQHTKIFTDTLANAVQFSSSNIGFTRINSEIINSCLTRIVATNPLGYNLVTEIYTDKEKKVDIVSELVNITDGTCMKIMDEFCKELENQGITADRKNRKATGGIAQLPFAKKLQKQGGEKRKFVNEQIITKSNKANAFQYIKNLIKED